MTRQRKTLPARGKKKMDDSLLIRSAESLGRVIGSLQRQLDAARQLTVRANGGAKTRGNGQVSPGNGAAKARPRATKSTAKKTRARKRSA